MPLVDERLGTNSSLVAILTSVLFGNPFNVQTAELQRSTLTREMLILWATESLIGFAESYSRALKTTGNLVTYVTPSFVTSTQNKIMTMTTTDGDDEVEKDTVRLFEALVVTAMTLTQRSSLM